MPIRFSSLANRLASCGRRCCYRPHTARSGDRVAPTLGLAHQAQCLTTKVTRVLLAVFLRPPDSPTHLPSLRHAEKLESSFSNRLSLIRCASFAISLS